MSILLAVVCGGVGGGITALILETYKKSTGKQVGSTTYKVVTLAGAILTYSIVKVMIERSSQ